MVVDPHLVARITVGDQLEIWACRKPDCACRDFEDPLLRAARLASEEVQRG